MIYLDSINFTEETGRDVGKEVIVIALSTCGFCKKALRYLRENNIAFKYVYFDDLEREEKDTLREELRSNFNERLAFPFLILDRKKAHVGFNEEDWNRLLDTEPEGKNADASMDGKSEDELEIEYTFVRKTADYKGWKLTPDEQFLRSLVEGLHKNRDRYGYYLCPCRESEGSRQADRDIVCPCDYAQPDIDEFGHCYCALYLSEDFVKSNKTPSSIPERRYRT